MLSKAFFGDGQALQAPGDVRGRRNLDAAAPQVITGLTICLLSVFGFHSLSRAPAVWVDFSCRWHPTPLESKTQEALRSLSLLLVYPSPCCWAQGYSQHGPLAFISSAHLQSLFLPSASSPWTYAQIP